MMPSADGAVSGRYICGMEGGGDDGLYYSTTTDYRLQGGDRVVHPKWITRPSPSVCYCNA